MSETLEMVESAISAVCTPTGAGVFELAAVAMCSNSAPGFNASTFASAEPDALADTMPAMSHPARGTCKLPESAPLLEFAALPTSPCTAALAEAAAIVDDFLRTELEAPAV